MILDKRIKYLKKYSKQLEEEFRKTQKVLYDGMECTQLKVIKAENHPVKGYDLRFVVKFFYGTEMIYTGYQLLGRDRKKEDYDDEQVIIMDSFKETPYLKHNPFLNKDTECYFLGKEYIMLTERPKFRMILLNAFQTIEFQYLDTNKILKRRIDPINRMIIFIYESLEDEEIYFAVYYITTIIEKQLVRLQHFPQYTDDVEIGMVSIVPSILYIYFYNKATGEPLDSYCFFKNGPFIYSQLAKHVVIDDKRFGLNLYEDKEMHWSFYQSFNEPTIYISPNRKEYYSFKIFDYYNIKGNINNMSLKMVGYDEMNEHKDIHIFHALDFHESQMLLDDSNLSDYLDYKQFTENKLYFAINAKEKNRYSVFR